MEATLRIATMGLLSDAQEVLKYDAAKANEYINAAKKLVIMFDNLNEYHTVDELNEAIQ